MREIKELNEQGEKQLRARELLGRSEEEENNISGLYGARGKVVKSGLDISNNDGVVNVAQKCPHNSLQNEYASLNLSARSETICAR